MSGKRLLLVDDDRLICWAIAQEVPAPPLSLCVCHDGKGALDRIRAAPYDLAILDVHLPDANGISILEETKRRSPATRAIVMSADADAANIRRAVAAGADQFVEKPFDLPEFGERVLGLLRDRADSRKHPRYPCRIPVRVSHLAGLPAGVGYPLRNMDGLVEDAGRGGFRIATDFPLAAGQVVRVKAWAAASADPWLCLVPSDASLEVRWTALAPGGFTAGLSFTHPPSLRGGPPGGGA